MLKGRDGAWHPTLALAGEECQCLAVDPHDERRAYCGTFTSGLWRSDDGGATWTPAPGVAPHQCHGRGRQSAGDRGRPRRALGRHRAERASTVPRTAAQPGPK
ncbi:MAG: hypothetical protein R2838_21465 [Caldilineaceae bacterium]